MGTYDRYSKFRSNGEIKIVNCGEILPKSTDMFERYEKNKTRLDIISYNYYNDPNYGWLILMANPEYGSMEYDIPDGTLLRIPYPLGETIEAYKKSIDLYNKLY